MFHTDEVMFILEAVDDITSWANVHESVNPDTYVVFGEQKIDDLSAKTQDSAAEQFPESSGLLAVVARAGADEVEHEVDVKKSGFEPKDIVLFMLQVSSSQSKAVPQFKELGKKEGDISNEGGIASCTSRMSGKKAGRPESRDRTIDNVDEGGAQKRG